MSAGRPRIGWAGTGRMGYAMVSRLLDAGHDVAVWNRTAARCAPLADRGATVVGDVGALADRDVVFTMVAASKDLAAVTLGDGGLLRQGPAPRILVDSSTVDGEVSARVREAAAGRGTAFLAAPVSGNAKVVEAGLLSLVASGPADAYTEVEPLLRVIGRSSTYVGDGETARLVKLCHNVLLGVVTQSLAEILVLAERGGVPRAAFLAFLNDSVMGSMFTRYKTPALVNLDFTPTFTPVLLHKDLDLGLAAARSWGVPMPVAALTHQLVATAIGHGRLAEDFAVLLLEQAAAAGLALTPEDTPVTDGLSMEDR